MKNIVIAGSGPVGSFIAVLCAQLGFTVTVYEKRAEFSRNINVKIESSFFKKVQDVFSRLNVQTEVFAELNERLHKQRNTILIKELEERFVNEAKSLGAKYIIREVESFEELYDEHKSLDSLILDCTGRSSKLRINEFGPDEDNIVTIPLQHAMYINCKAKMTGNVSLYQVMKNIGNIKLTEVVVSKCKDNNGFSDITVPVFIDNELAHIFNNEHPDINRNPLNPFNSSNPVSNSIFLPISSIVGNLIADGCTVNLNSVKVKKIEISCGYAINRSNDKFVCLGDSAIHLAFFRSLNLGLKHALDFFIQLAVFHMKGNVQFISGNEITARFKEHHPLLNPIMVHPTVARNVFLVVTKGARFECFSFNLTNYRSKKLTSPLGINESQIHYILEELNKKLSAWNYLLLDFEVKRDEDIKKEIHSNTAKSELYDYASWFISVNGKSFVKMSELARAVSGKYPLFKKDFDFFLTCFKSRREALMSNTSNDCVLINIISNLVSQVKSLTELKEVCAKDLSSEEKIQLVKNIIFKKRRVNQIDIISSEIIDFITVNNNKNVSSNFVIALIRNELEIQSLPSDTSSTLDATFEAVAGPSNQGEAEERELRDKYDKQKGLISNISQGFIKELQKGVSHVKDVDVKGKYVVNQIAKVSNVGCNFMNDLQKEFTGINFKHTEKTESMCLMEPQNESTNSASGQSATAGNTSSILSPFVSAAVKSKKLILPKMEITGKTLSKFTKFTK